jgi:uncharacterized membrane protein YbhN (UPF0104 family)
MNRGGRWIASAAVILLVAWAAMKVDWPAALAVLRHASPAVVALAIVVNLLSVMLRGLRWWIFLRRAGAVPLAVAVRGAIVGSGFNNLLVANGGDAARALLVSRAAGLSRSTTVATLALDRLFDPVCFGLLLLIGTFVVPLPAALAHSQPIVAGVLLLVIGLLVLLARARPPETDPSVVIVGWRATRRAFRQQLAHLSTARRFGAAMSVSAGIWALQVGVFALAARSVGLALPIAGSIAAMLLTNAGLILRATPGNIGYFQFAYALAASRFGVPNTAGVAAALLLQMVQIVPVTLLALILAPRMVEGRKNQ